MGRLERTENTEQDKQSSVPSSAAGGVPGAPQFTGSSALPTTPAAPWSPFAPILAQLGAFTSVHVEKLDQALVQQQLELTKDLAEKIHLEGLRSYELQDKNTDYLYDLAKRREVKDDGILIYLGIVVFAILAVGVILLFKGSTAEGIGIVSAVLGLLLGFLGGYGVARKST